MSADSDDEFWRDDAATSRRTAELKASGLTLPPASKPVPVDPDVVVSHYRPVRQRSNSAVMFWVGFCLCVVVTAAVGGWLWRSSPVITLDEYQRIQPGMTRAECVAVVGCEPNSTASGEFSFPTVPSLNVESLCWINADESGAAIVLMNGKVTADRMQVRLK